MAFPRDYDPETLDLMTGVLDSAWDEVELALASNDYDPAGLRLRIMAAVREGEHDPERLKALARDAIAKAY